VAVPREWPGRLGFASGDLSVPADFDQMGSGEIERGFRGEG